MALHLPGLGDYIRVVAADDNQEFINRVLLHASSSTVFRLVGQAATGRDAIHKAEQLAPHVLIVSRYLPDMVGLEVAEQVGRRVPGVQVILVDDCPDVPLAIEAQGRGIRRVLPKSVSREELEQAVREVVETARRELEEAARRFPLFAPGRHPLAPPKPEETRLQVVTVGRETIAFYHPKGGVGKTSTLVNMAAALTANRVLKVKPVALDFDVDYGSLAAALGWGHADVEAGRTVVHWAHFSEPPQTLEETEELLMHHRSGLLALAAPRNPADEGLLTAELAERIIDTVQRFYDPVLIDCTIDLRDSTIIALQRATRVILVSTLDYLAIDRLTKFREKQESLGIPPYKCFVVLNRTRNNAVFSVRDAVDYLAKLGYTFLEALPYDPGVEDAMNRGQPYFLENPRSEYAAGIRSIVHGIWRVYPEDRPARRGGLGSLFGRRQLLGRQ
nr:MAG: hypothetical protein DIU70_10040 [Bacillota bacterium]